MQVTSENPNLALGVDEFIRTVKNIKPFQTDTFEAARAVIAQLQSTQTFKDDVERNDFDIPLDDKGYIPVRIVRRVEAEKDLPIIFYVHGGGWVLGNAMTYDRLLRKLAKGSYAAVVFAEYTPVPEARYPTQLEELWTVLSHILKNAEMYHINPHKLIMAGDGTGANMAAILTNYARKQGIHTNYQLLLYPSLDANLNLDSYSKFYTGPWLGKATMQWYWDNYLPDISMRNQDMVSPLLIPDDELHGLPDTLIITAENDVTREDGETYARKLTNAGVNAVSVRFNGTIHDFLMLQPLAHTAPTQAAFRLISATLRQILWDNDCYTGISSEEHDDNI